MSPSEPAPPIRLLLCDDHAVVRAGLRALLSTAHDIDVVGEAAGGEEALALTARLRPDIVLMDLHLGTGIDGVTTTRRLTADDAEHPDTPRPRVLVLTMFDTDADITRAIEAGATGYLLKAEQPAELFTAIRNAASGRTALSAPVAGRVLAHLRNPRPALSARELEILQQLAHGHSNRAIARALFISETTVKTHLQRIYTKLDVRTRTAAVAAATRQRLLP